MTVIHATDIVSFMTCEKQWSYAQKERIYARSEWEGAAFGTAGHFALEQWYGGKVAKPAEALLPREDWRASLGLDAEKELRSLLTRYYWRYHHELPKLTVHALETQLVVRVPKTRVSLVMTLDMRYSPGKQSEIFGMDHKFYKSLKSPKQLAMDMQMTVYLWGTRAAGLPLAGMVYNQIWKRKPDTPEILKNGRVPVAQNLVTSYHDYKHFLLRHKQDPSDERYAPFLAALKDRGNPFFVRHLVERSNTALDLFEDELIHYARRMTSSTTFYSYARNFSCNLCEYQALCIGDRNGEPRHYYVGKSSRFPYARKSVDMR